MFSFILILHTINHARIKTSLNAVCAGFFRGVFSIFLSEQKTAMEKWICDNYVGNKNNMKMDIGDVDVINLLFYLV